MLAVRGTFKKGKITLDQPVDSDKQIPIIVTFLEAPDGEKKKKNYDFSDLAGKLQWKGDPVDQQRALRESKSSIK